MSESKYVFIPVNIPVEKGSALYNRLVNLADAMECRLDVAVANVVTLGVNGHIEQNITLYEKTYY